MKGSLRSPEGIRSIAKKHSRLVRPFIRFFLGRCGECPSRILCLEDSLGGDGELLVALLSFDCEHGERPGRVAREISVFATSNCMECPALPACEQYLGNHVLKVKAADREAWPPSKRFIGELVDRCGDCPELASCVDGALRGVGGVPRIMFRHLRVRLECRLGLREHR
jgi:hypothetical protein